MRTTIKDVAKMAGVSISTVSRVINHTEYGVDPLLQEKVRNAVKQSGYRPNQIAKSMVTHHTNTIAVLSPDVGHPFYHDIIIGMNEVALKEQYSLLLYNTNGDLENERANLDLIFSRSVDGMILIGYFEEKVKKIMKKFPEMPFVVLDEMDGLEGVGQVFVDDEEAVYGMVSYVIEMGHKKIGCIVGPKEYAIVKKRLEGYKRAIADHHIPFEENFIGEGKLTEESAKAPAEYLIKKEGVTAIVCLNDLMAYGVYQKAMEMGIAIPDELSVCGFDGISFSEYLNPPLTTCHQPGLEMGRQSMMLLLNKVQGKAGTEQKICLECQLQIRPSIKKIDN